MAAAELDTTEARRVAAAVLEQADGISVQATSERWRCGLADQLGPSRTEEGTSQ
jgi:hypothetical protein